MNYYNEFDPYAAQWLKNLINAKHIPDGFVDTRDIRTVKARELKGYTQVHLFAGIGGWALALRLAGWPEDEKVWTGSCPCQPFSVAGKKKGTTDERHLWPEFFRILGYRRPPVVFGEQVASKDGRIWLNGVRTDLEGLGYGVGAADLCAAGVGAPHIRQRLYWVAHTDSGRREQCNERQRAVSIVDAGRSTGRLGDADGSGLETRDSLPIATGPGPELSYEPSSPCRAADPSSEQEHEKQQRSETVEGGRGSVVPSRRGVAGFWGNFDLLPCTDGKSRRIEPGTFPLAHGVPGRVGKLRAYGNAIVPQVAAEFIKAYLEVRNASV